MHVSKTQVAGRQEQRSANEDAPCDDQLLSALWRLPNQCHQIGVLDANGKFKNLEVKDAVQAIRQAFDLSRAGNNTYFACAEYLTSDNRTAANVSGAWGFWADIDCGQGKPEAGKGYSKVEEAEEAVKLFCIKAGIPSPTHIVNSGSGLHVYWVLDGKVDREPWQATAKKLKALTKTLGFLADDSRTSDIASVLRVPGTLNYKYTPPRPVSLLRAANNFINRDKFLSAIDSAYKSLCSASVKSCLVCAPSIQSVGGSDKASNDQEEVGLLPFLRLTEEQRTAHLVLLQVIMRHPDADSCRAEWISVGMALHFETAGSEDGFALFDAWSSRGKKYKGGQETRTAWRSFRSVPGKGFNIATLFWMAEKAGASREMILAEAEPFEICGSYQDAA